jgi:hypothetical protein
LHWLTGLDGNLTDPDWKTPGYKLLEQADWVRGHGRALLVIMSSSFVYVCPQKTVRIMVHDVVLARNTHLD